MSLELDYPEDLTVVSREEWGAEPPKVIEDEPLRQLKIPVGHVFFNDTASSMCDGLQECSRILQNLQMSHKSFDYPDITHNFLVSGDGVIYEGRGWDFEPDEMEDDLCGNVIDIAFIGSFDLSGLMPLPSVIKSAEKLIEHGVKLQKIKSDYDITWFTYYC